MTSSAEEKQPGRKKSPAVPGAPGRPFRVLVADDHVLARHLARRQLQMLPNLQVVGEATDGFEAVALARTLGPDLVLMDIGMPGLDGFEATRRIAAEFPRMRVIMFSSHDEQSFGESALAAGAVGYVVKGEPTERLAAAIQKAFGGRWLSGGRRSG